MTLREELEDRADKLDAELLGLRGRMKEIERQSNELHTCLNALDIAEMDAEDAALEPAPIPEPETQEPAPPSVDEPAEFISDLTGDPAVEPESGLHGEPVPQPEWNEGYAPVTNPDAEAQAKALDYYSPERVAERNRFNPFNIFKREDA